MIEKIVYGNMNWWDVSEQPSSFEDIPTEFTKSYDLYNKNSEKNYKEILNLLQPFIMGFFIAENIEDYDEIFAFDDIPECESFLLEIVGVDFKSQSPLPRVKTQALFKVPFVDNIDNVNLDEYFQKKGGELYECISFRWNLPDDDDELDLTFGDNQGAEACIQNEDTFNTA